MSPRAGGGTTERKPSGFEARHPGNPEGKRGREALMRFPGVAQGQGRRGGLGPSGRAFPPLPPPGGRTKSERSRSPPLRPPPPAPRSRSPGVAFAGRSPRACKSAGPPLCDFTRFATSPGRPRPTHSRAASSQPAASLRSPRFPYLRGRACPAVAEPPSRPPVAVRAVAAAPRVGTCAEPTSQQRRAAPRSGPAERSALLVAARCCAS